MKDFDYDVKEKKTLVSSARRRKNGSKSKRCTLPSDKLTPAQRKKLDGPVQVYNVRRPTTWGQFKAWPLDIQQSHLAFIQNSFEMGLVTIGRTVFGLQNSTLTAYCKRMGLRYQVFQGPPDKSMKAKLMAWIAEGRYEPEEETAETAETAEQLRPLPAGCGLQNIRLSGSGAVLAQAIYEMLGGHSVELELSFRFLD